MNHLNIKNTITLLLSILISQLFYGQDLNQKEAIKNFKKGTYKSWGANNDNSVFDDGKCDITFKYDDDGKPHAVMLNSAEYHLHYIEDYNRKYQVYTNTHFLFKKKDLSMLLYDERLFIFRLNSDGKFIKFNSVIGKKIKDFSTYEELFKAHALKMKAVAKEKKSELTALEIKANPSAYFKKVYDVSEGFRKVDDHNGNVGFINAQNEVVIPCEYEDSYDYFKNSVIGVKKDGKYGYINAQNEIIIPFNKPYVEVVKNNRILVTETDGTFGIYDISGKLITGDFDNAYWDSTIEGYYVRKGNDHGYYGNSDKILWVMKDRDYDEIVMTNNYYVVIKNNMVGLVNATSLKEVLKPTYDMVLPLGRDLFSVETASKVGVFDPLKGFVTEAVYDKIEGFKDGKAQITDGIALGKVDERGNVAWNNGKQTTGVLSTQPLNNWRSKYSTSGVVYNGELTLVSKNSKFGYVNEGGELVIPMIYTSATEFKNGLATVQSNGEYFSINKLQEKMEYSSTGSNSIEMSFDYAYVDGTKAHLGVVWDKKTGLNRVFSSTNIYNYAFNGSANYDLTPTQLSPIIGERGEIMMKARQYGGGRNKSMFRYKILAWNTYSGKYLMFEFDKKKGKFIAVNFANSPNLKESYLKSDKGGRVMLDFVYFYAGRDDFSSEKIVGWNTLTGKNSVEDDFVIPGYKPEVDGEILVQFSMTASSKFVNAFPYTSKTLKTEKECLAKKLGDDAYKSGLDYRADKNSEHTLMFKNVFGKNYEMMIFEQSTLNNSIGLRKVVFSETDHLFLYENLKLEDYNYSYLRNNSNEEIGVMQIGCRMNGKLEYMFWNKSTGHLTLFTYQKGDPSKFKQTISVSENLLDLKASTASTKVSIGGSVKEGTVASNNSKTSNSNGSANMYSIRNKVGKPITIVEENGTTHYLMSNESYKVHCKSPIYLQSDSGKSLITNGEGVCGTYVDVN